MIYKNNYQRKQAVWREKWLKKVAERQTQKAFVNAGESLRKAFDLIAEAIPELVKTLSDGINAIAEALNDPDVIEKLRKAQEEKELQ